MNTLVGARQCRAPTRCVALFNEIGIIEHPCLKAILQATL